MASPLPRYFSIEIGDDKALLSRLTTQLNTPEHKKAMLEHQGASEHKDLLRKLMIGNRIQPKLHVTLTHISNLKKPLNSPEIQSWDQWIKIFGQSYKRSEKENCEDLGIYAKFKLDKVIFNKSALIILVTDITFHKDKSCKLQLETVPLIAKDFTYITIGAMTTEKTNSLNSLIHELLQSYQLFKKIHPQDWQEKRSGAKGFNGLIVLNWDTSSYREVKGVNVVACYK